MEVLINAKKSIMIVAFVLILANIMYGIYQIKTIIQPYTGLLFHDIKSEKEIQEFFDANKGEIEKVVGVLNTLPYDEIIILDWLLEESHTIYVNDESHMLEDVVDDSQQICSFVKNNKIVCIFKTEKNVYIVTDTARDYEQGIVWDFDGNGDFQSQEIADIYYKERISKNYWFYKGRD